MDLRFQVKMRATLAFAALLVIMAIAQALLAEQIEVLKLF
jgi:hypothetical protein